MVTYSTNLEVARKWVADYTRDQPPLILFAAIEENPENPKFMTSEKNKVHLLLKRSF